MDGNEKRKFDERLLEVIRLGKDDSDDPLVQELIRAIQADASLAARYSDISRWDAIITALIQSQPDVSGLEQRLLNKLSGVSSDLKADRIAEQVPSVDQNLAQLQAVSLANKVDKITSESEVVNTAFLRDQGLAPTDETSVELPLESAVHPRRRFLRWFVGASLAASLGGIGVWIWRTRTKTPKWTPEQFADDVARHFEATLNEFGTGTALEKATPPGGVTLSREIQLIRGTVVTWRPVQLREVSGVAFDISHPGGEQGTLYALPVLIPGLPQMPPRRPLHRTSRTCIGWWQEAQRSYALAVLGSPRTYQRFLVPLGPLT